MLLSEMKAYSLVLDYYGTSLDAEAPALKILWLLPFVWILFESIADKRFRREAAA